MCPFELFRDRGRAPLLSATNVAAFVVTARGAAATNTVSGRIGTNTLGWATYGPPDGVIGGSSIGESSTIRSGTDANRLIPPLGAAGNVTSTTSSRGTCSSMTAATSTGVATSTGAGASSATGDGGGGGGGGTCAGGGNGTVVAAAGAGSSGRSETTCSQVSLRIGGVSTGAGGSTCSARRACRLRRKSSGLITRSEAGASAS